MSPNLTLVLVGGALIAAGVYLLLERSLTRILIGVMLLANGANVLFLVASGPAGGAPIVGVTPAGQMSDPLPQAMVLTAIVITLGVTAFLLTLAYRSFQINGHDEVADDVEDAAIRELAEADLAAGSYEEEMSGPPDETGEGNADEEGERPEELDATDPEITSDPGREPIPAASGSPAAASGSNASGQGG